MPTSVLASPRGATRPRVEVAPPYAYSLGTEAIELARCAGLELDLWQEQALVLLLAVRDDGKWACFEYAELVARQNGKGAILEARALAGFFLLGEQLIMWSAHEFKTSAQAFRRFRQLLRNLGVQIGDNENLLDVDGILIKVHNTNGEEGFERLDTLQQIKYVARSKGSGRGFSGDLVFVDEAFAYSAVQQDAMMPTTLARPNPQIVYTSSPPLDGFTGEVLFALRKRAAAGGDGALGYRDWGLDGDLDHLDKIDLDDPDNWAATNPGLGIRITAERIATLRRSMSDAGFAREVLGLWPTRREGGGAIDMAQWASMTDPLSRRDGDVGLGVDIAPTGDYAAIALYGTRVDGLGHGQLVDYRAGMAWIVPRLVELREVLGPVAVGMGRGTYASLETDLAKEGFTRPDDEDKPKRGDLAVAGGADMSAACGQLLDATRQASFRHLGQQQLDAAASGAHTKVGSDTIAWSRKDASTDICPVVSLTAARWAFVTRVDALAVPVAPATAKVPDTPPDPTDLWRPSERLRL